MVEGHCPTITSRSVGKGYWERASAQQLDVRKSSATIARPRCPISKAWRTRALQRALLVRGHPSRPESHIPRTQDLPARQLTPQRPGRRPEGILHVPIRRRLLPRHTCKPSPSTIPFPTVILTIPPAPRRPPSPHVPHPLPRLPRPLQPPQPSPSSRLPNRRPHRHGTYLPTHRRPARAQTPQALRPPLHTRALRPWLIASRTLRANATHAVSWPWRRARRGGRDSGMGCHGL